MVHLVQHRTNYHPANFRPIGHRHVGMPQVLARHVEEESIDAAVRDGVDTVPSITAVRE